jgi:hypothetical protein
MDASWDLLLTRPRTHSSPIEGRTAMNGTRTPLTTTRDVYDVAQLAGGLARLVDTAVVELVERGRLTVESTGRLKAVGRSVHPVEAAVLELVGLRARRTIASVRLRAEEDPRLTGVAERLVAEGLLRRNPLAGFSRSRSPHLRTAAGRRVLAEWRAAPPASGPGVEVALGGWLRLTDPALAERVFGSPEWARPVGRGPGQRSLAALETGGTSTWAYGGWAGWGGGGWGGDGGGGFGGGDGGCGGGDGGGGGC